MIWEPLVSVLLSSPVAPRLLYYESPGELTENPRPRPHAVPGDTSIPAVWPGTVLTLSDDGRKSRGLLEESICQRVRECPGSPCTASQSLSCAVVLPCLLQVHSCPPQAGGPHRGLPPSMDCFLSAQQPGERCHCVLEDSTADVCWHSRARRGAERGPPATAGPAWRHARGVLQEPRATALPVVGSG